MSEFDKRLSNELKSKLSKLEEAAKELGFVNSRFLWMDAGDVEWGLFESLDNACPDRGMPYKVECYLDLGFVEEIKEVGDE